MRALIRGRPASPPQQLAFPFMELLKCEPKTPSTLERVVVILRSRSDFSSESELVLRRAHSFMQRAHRGQKRLDGSPYWTHPEKVGEYVALHGGSPTQVVAAFLHDVIEDCGVRLSSIEKDFGKEVARLVSSLTKPRLWEGRWVFADDPLYYAIPSAGLSRWLRKERNDIYFQRLVTPENFDALVIKMFDALHNLETIGAFPEMQRRRKIEDLIHYTLWLAERLDPQLHGAFLERLGRFGPLSHPSRAGQKDIALLPPRELLNFHDFFKFPPPGEYISVYYNHWLLLAENRLELGLPNRFYNDPSILKRAQEFFPNAEISLGKSLLNPSFKGSELILIVSGCFQPPKAKALIHPIEGGMRFKISPPGGRARIMTRASLLSSGLKEFPDLSRETKQNFDRFLEGLRRFYDQEFKATRQLPLF